MPTRFSSSGRDRECFLGRIAGSIGVAEVETDVGDVTQDRRQAALVAELPTERARAEVMCSRHHPLAVGALDLAECIDRPHHPPGVARPLERLFGRGQLRHGVVEPVLLGRDPPEDHSCVADARIDPVRFPDRQRLERVSCRR